MSLVTAHITYLLKVSRFALFLSFLLDLSFKKFPIFHNGRGLQYTFLTLGLD